MHPRVSLDSARPGRDDLHPRDKGRSLGPSQEGRRHRHRRERSVELMDLHALFDREVFEAALRAVLDDPAKLPALIQANGIGPEDLTPWPMYADLIQVLQRAHVNGEAVTDLDLLASRLVESSATFKIREAWVQTLA